MNVIITIGYGTISVHHTLLFYSTPYAHEDSARYTVANGNIQVNHDSLLRYITRHQRSMYSSDAGNGIIHNIPPLYEKDGIDSEAAPYEVPVVTINHVCYIRTYTS